METNIDELLGRAVEVGATNVHLKVGSAPIVRVDGELRPLDGFETLRPEDTEGYAEELLIPQRRVEFEEKGSADFAYGRKDIGRFRVTVFRQRGSVSLVMRRVMPGSKSFAELGLPKVIETVASAKSGLVLITGPSGSGKTTTMASIIDWINANRGVSILTIEDPIEVLHPDNRSVVAQREVGVDTTDVSDAIRQALRHDTDVILVSEIADYETARAAIDAAETGHLVVSSMRTADPAETVNRLLSFFPESQLGVVRRQLAAQTVGIVSQVLLEGDRGARVLACEVLTNNERVHEWILTGGESRALIEIVKDSSFHGMQTFDQAILKHVVEQSVPFEAAAAHARNGHEIKAKALAAGVTI